MMVVVPFGLSAPRMVLTSVACLSRARLVRSGVPVRNTMFMARAFGVADEVWMAGPATR